MPVVYVCKRCGKPLIVIVRQGQTSLGVPTPSEVIAIYDGRCPWCGAELRRPSLDDITIDVDRDRWRQRLIGMISILPSRERMELMRELEKLEERRRRKLAVPRQVCKK